MRLGALAVALVLLTGCEMALSNTEPYGTVRVQAVSPGGLPLAGVNVLLYTGRRPMGYARTDGSGLVTFHQVPPGGYGVLMTLTEDQSDLFESTGQPYRDGIEVVAGRQTTVVFRYEREPLGAAEALVVDSSGVGLPGLLVDFYRSSGVIKRVLTNASGVARADSLPPGQYGVALQPPDSLGVPGAPYVFKDGLTVDRNVTPRATLTLATCRGSISVSVRDQNNLPIIGMGVRRYSSLGSGTVLATDGGGNAAFTLVHCGEHGAALQALDGYGINFVRDSGFVDGLIVTKGSAVTALLRATRLSP